MSEEPQVYKLARNKLIYSIVAIIFIATASFLETKKISLGWLVFLVLLVIYLFIPFLYRLIVSNEAISSINYFRAQTLEWSEINEIRLKRNGIMLFNADDSIKVFIDSQIDGYPGIVKLLQQKRPELWKLQETTEFHQSIFESTLLLVIGIGIFLFAIYSIVKNKLSNDVIVLILLAAVSAYLVWGGLSRIRKVSIDNDSLLVKYLLWERIIHAGDIQSIALEQQMNKNKINYFAHVRLKNGKEIVLENIKEGNPIFVSTIEQWLENNKRYSS